MILGQPLWVHALGCCSLTHQCNSTLGELSVVETSLIGTMRSVIHGARTNAILMTGP